LHTSSDFFFFFQEKAAYEFIAGYWISVGTPSDLSGPAIMWCSVTAAVEAVGRVPPASGPTAHVRCA
ncbi:hypothetical protein, partial [Mycobacteroides abscessus]|uniref:hypothetical protein n=1 Tax=Mycobacteroides abscessus TaxID=36809 RepID=UPI0019CFC396